MNNVLVYLQDVGGTNYLLPFLLKLRTAIKEKATLYYVVHPLSESVIKEKLTDINKLSNKEYPVDENEWLKIINKNDIHYILCTLSANSFDPSNAMLISLAQERRIPVIGFMDHWKGFDRLIDEKGGQKYCPDWLGVIDEASIKKLRSYGINRPVVRAVGNPILEKVMLNKQTNTNEYKILLVSQPEIFTKSYDSLFSITVNNTRLVDEVVMKIKNSNHRYKIYYRTHPKDNNINNLPQEVKLDGSQKSEIFSSYDLFIGFNSMLLFEAHLAGCNTISLTFPEFSNVYEDDVPYSYALNVDSIDKFLSVIEKRDFSFRGVDRNVFLNSTNRCVEFFNEFLMQN